MEPNELFHHLSLLPSRSSVCLSANSTFKCNCERFCAEFQLWLDRERPQSRCVCRERDGGPHSLLSTWDGAIIDDMPRSEGHLTGRLSRLVVKDPLLCMCLWETLMFIYRGKKHQSNTAYSDTICCFAVI